MNTGRNDVMRLWLFIFLAVLPVLAGPVHAERTPPAVCAADSLYLLSPPTIKLELHSQAPLGMELSWPNLNLNQATCFSLTDTVGLGYTVDVSGGFGDKVDRVFRFSSPDSGLVGKAQKEPLILSWVHEGPSTYGSFEGMINLNNNGGIWHYSASAEATDDPWIQRNKGLPMTWKQVNVVALCEGSDGTMIAGFTSGQALASDPEGLYINHGDTWERIAADIFDDITLITQVAVSPTNSDDFLVGTQNDGLFVTHDGGHSFTQMTTEIDPGADSQPTQFRVSALAWLGDKIFLYLNNFGVFTSTDRGDSFSRLDFVVPSDLDSREPDDITPIVNSFDFDPSHPDHILASLQFHGVYESDDGGTTWHDLYGDLLVPDPEITGVWVNSALSAVTDPRDDNVVVMAISQKGLYRTTDGGLTWTEVALDVQPENRAVLLQSDLVSVASQPGLLYAQENSYGLLKSEDFGATWTLLDNQVDLPFGFLLFEDPTNAGDLVLGTYKGGDYKAGTPLSLSSTYTTGTSEELRDLDLGLQISFSDGLVRPDSSFRLVCQTFQGWAVWRSPSHDPRHPELVGLYDRVNPESCLEGYCGDLDIQVQPQCFAAKRAACFDVSDPDTVHFFDADVYNGFAYYYSVTSFDYGNTALTTPANNSNELLFSPRWSGVDSLSRFRGSGNQSYVQVNLEAEPAIGGDEIYVFPNPLRPGKGIPGEEGKTVVFTNLPEGASIRIFTVAGDDVMSLGSETLHGGQIYWNTENRDHESVAPGVYLYKVEMPQRSEYWGRLVVIR